jgi:hypothetical protein
MRLPTLSHLFHAKCGRTGLGGKVTGRETTFAEQGSRGFKEDRERCPPEAEVDGSNPFRSAGYLLQSLTSSLCHP